MLEVVGNDEFAAACQEIIVLGKCMNGAVSLACRQAEAYDVVGLPFHVEAWSDEVAVFAAVVSPYASHHYEPIVEVVGVLSVNARHGLLLVVASLRGSSLVVESVQLSKIVVVEA